MIKIDILDYTKDAEWKIGSYAGICYGKTVESGDEETCVKRAKHCVSKGHLSTLRFAYATFRVSGISRACSHQFVRSKHLDFLQRSQRYCNDRGFGVTEPKYTHAKQEVLYKQAVAEAYRNYETLIGLGMKKEDARFLLPQGSHTELIVTGNYQAWLDFINLRNTKEAQWEIREVAHKINNSLWSIAPNIFGEL